MYTIKSDVKFPIKLLMYKLKIVLILLFAVYVSSFEL